MPIKVDFNKEIHIFKEPFTSMQQLMEFIKSSFKKLPQFYGIWYIDHDGDSICVSCNDDLDVLQESGKNQKLYIKEIKEEAWMLEQEEFQMIQKMEDIVMYEPEIKQEIMITDVKEAIQKMDDTKVPLENKEMMNWACPSCTYLNQSFLFFCDMCNCMKPLESEIKLEKKLVEIKPKKSLVVQFKPELLMIMDKPMVEMEKKVEKKEEKKDKKKEDKKLKRQKNIQKLVRLEIEKNLQSIADKVKSMMDQQQPQNDFLSELLKNQEPEKPQIVHDGFICDGCEGPIIGCRYECGICRNFDYCEKCEATIDHIHPFLKIRNPSQAVMIDFISENDLHLINKMTSEKSTSSSQQVQTPEVMPESKTMPIMPMIPVETIGKEDKPKMMKQVPKYTKDVKMRAKQVKQILGGQKKNYYELCQVNESINDVINIILGEQLPVKVYDVEVIKKSNMISEILGQKPEEYYEIVEMIMDKPMDDMIEYIMYQQEYAYKQI